MTIKELKKIIEKLPDTMDVFIAERKSYFKYGLVNSAYTEEIIFTEDENPSEDEIKNAPKEKVLILEEE